MRAHAALLPSGSSSRDGSRKKKKKKRDIYTYRDMKLVDAITYREYVK